MHNIVDLCQQNSGTFYECFRSSKNVCFIRVFLKLHDRNRIKPAITVV